MKIASFDAFTCFWPDLSSAATPQLFGSQQVITIAALKRRDENIRSNPMGNAPSPKLPTHGDGGAR